MKVWIPLLSFFIIILTLGANSGCGGGSGGTTSTTSTTSTTGATIVRYAVEAKVNGAIIDPTNIQQGEVAQFEVAGYTASNQRIVQSSSGWTLDPTGQTEGTLTSGGQFTATASGPLFTLSADAAGQQRTGSARVKAAGQAIVKGRIIDGQGGTVYGLQLDFYDSGNNLVGSSVTQGDGTFRAIIPSTATAFEVNRGSIRAGYYKEYLYNNKWYLPKPSNCIAPLPPVANGQTTNLLTDVIVPPTSVNGSSLPPPPPPSPCGP